MQYSRLTLALVLLSALGGFGAACSSSDGMASDAGAAGLSDAATRDGATRQDSDAEKDAGATSCPRERSAFYDGDAFTLGTRLSLATVCSRPKWEACPTDLASAATVVSVDGTTGPAFCWKTLTTGCGVTTVEQSWGTHGTLAAFDSKTGKLIGYGFFDDVGFAYDRPCEREDRKASTVAAARRRDTGSMKYRS